MVKLTSLLLLSVLPLSGCAAPYEWVKNSDVGESHVHKIESPLASEFCSALLGGNKAGCAVWTDAKRTRCVIVIAPGSGEAAAHEAGGHCMGYDHR